MGFTMWVFSFVIFLVNKYIIIPTSNGLDQPALTHSQVHYMEEPGESCLKFVMTLQTALINVVLGRRLTT